MRRADNLPPSCAVVIKSGNLNFLEPSGPVMGLLYLYLYLIRKSHDHSFTAVRKTEHDSPCHHTDRKAVPCMYLYWNSHVRFSFFHLSVAKQLNLGLGCFIVEVYSWHTTSRTPMNKWWACNRPLPTQQTNSHDLARIQTQNQAATDLHLRLHGHWDHGHVLLKYISPVQWI